MSERDRLFHTAQLALLATAFCFAGVASAVGGIRAELALTNAEVGTIAGAALWGLAVGQLLLAPACDAIGFRRMLLLAALLQAGGVAAMIAAPGYALLVGGAALISIGNGAVEAACNPLVATLYPERKAARLNHFHVWFPGGIALGGVLAYALDLIGLPDWRLKIAIIGLPLAAYLLRTLAQRFPKSEAHAAGLGALDSVRATVAAPLMGLMLLLMLVTASVELGPNRWVPAVLEAGGLPGILVLVFINGVMALLRASAEPVLHRLTPFALLAGSLLLAAAGLALIARGGGLVLTLAASALFAAGCAFLWPTMVGVVAERLPRTGATGLGLIAAAGAAFVGLVTTPAMGDIADRHIRAALPPGAVAGIAADVTRRAPTLIAAAPERRRGEVRALVAAASPRAGVDFARRLIATLPDDPAAARAARLLRPLENRGGLASFAYLVPFAIGAALVFALLAILDRRRGGYRAAVARARLSAQEELVP